MEFPQRVGNALLRSWKTLQEQVKGGWRSLLGLRRPRVQPANAGDEDEFEALLAELGSETDENQGSIAATQLRLAQTTIEELRHNLLELQPLGELLAEAERSRLELLEELERACGERPRNNDQKLQTALARSQKKLAIRDRKLARQTERVELWRTRYDERRCVAAERWRELVQLRRENRELARATER